MADDDQHTENSELIQHAAAIVSAYLTHNSLGVGEVPALIERTYQALLALSGATAEATADAALTPAVPVKRSVTKTHLVCLEDGQRFKTLKRHLMTSHGMTPQDYREKWGLPADYPMVAANYADVRSNLAKSVGLGKVRRKR